MDIKNLRIVFLGTPGFAVAPLEALLDADYKIQAVVTAPDRPAGRGKKLRISEVKAKALERGLTLLQPTNLKDPDFINSLEALKPDLMVVVAFRMLPSAVWKIPALGTFNLHASLLPQYRGAAPINHVIMNGESLTGVTTFLIDEEIDTGNILLQEELVVGPEDSAGDLHDRMMDHGALLVVKTVKLLASGGIRPKPQALLSETAIPLKKAPKIFKEDCLIPWDNTGQSIFNLIRGLSPYPTAFTFLTRQDETRVLCKIYASSFRPEDHNNQPGTILSDGKAMLSVAVRDGWIEIHSIQQEGKRRMDVKDFLAGINLSSFLPRFS